MKPPKARILVVEDDASIRNGLSDVLTFNGFAVKGEADGKKGLELALEDAWDLILLDVMLPSMGGFVICDEIRRSKPKQGIIMLTAKGAEEDIITGFKSGADDYISKPFSLRELMLRIEALLRRLGKTNPEAQIECQGILFDGNTLTATFEANVASITRKEMDIMAYLKCHSGRIVSKKELLIEVWRYADADIETRTVDIHMLKLRKKIANLVGDQPVIRIIRGEGYRLEPLA
jgi:DNA-binding response OmpR family regulator